MNLKTNYVDDILDTTQNTKRKYREVTNSDGSKTFEDVTKYKQRGTIFGAKQLNETNAILNEFSNEKADYLAGKKFNTVQELLDYAETLFKKREVSFMPVGINDANSILAPYSPGFISVKYDTCIIAIFMYTTGVLNVNGKSASGKWSGWKKYALANDLEKYLPLKGGKLTGSLEVNGDLYSKKTNDNEAQAGVENALHKIYLCASAAGNGGLYDGTHSKWLLRDDKNGKVDYAQGTMGGVKVMRASDFSVSGTADKATLTINLD